MYMNKNTMYRKLDFGRYKKYVNYVEGYDDSSLCPYTFIRIKKKINDQERVMPRVRVTYDMIKSPTSLQDFMEQDEILFAINAGIFNTKTEKPECVLICDKKILVDQMETYIHINPEDGGDKRQELYILGIMEDGKLIIYPPKTTCEKILNDGCVDAVMGFVPLIVDGNMVNEDEVCSYISYSKNPRQIIGEDEEGNYFVLTVHNPGMTLDEVRNLLYKFHVETAYNLDGGSSTQTVFHKQRLTPVYREKTGRRIPSVITFEIITGDLVIGI